MTAIECTYCGYEHATENCDRRCHLCGQHCSERDAVPPVHRECFEANGADQNIPVGEAARERWAQDRERAIDDSRDYERGAL